MYKTYTHPLPWTDKTDWQWPMGDRKLVQVFEHVSDIDRMMTHVSDHRICVQAGGACGVWPLRFSQLFEWVYTFEPQPENYQCLVNNTREAKNIIARHSPLTNDHQGYRVHNDIVERENYGAGYVVPDQTGVQSVRIDDLLLDSCGLIQLDIEGYELDALKGGRETIDAYRPTIVLEEKPLNHVRGDHTAPRKWLEKNFGYELVDKIHRDVILC